MKFVTVRDFRSNPAQLWRDLKKEQELIVTHNGKPIGLLTPIKDTDFEESLNTYRRSRTLLAVHKMRANAKLRSLDHLTPQEIQSEIKSTRKTG